MKFKLLTVTVLSVLSVFTGTVNAQNENNKDLVKDKTITMQLIDNSLEQQSLEFAKIQFESDIKTMLTGQPFEYKRSFFARNAEPSRSDKSLSEE